MTTDAAQAQRVETIDLEPLITEAWKRRAREEVRLAFDNAGLALEDPEWDGVEPAVHTNLRKEVRWEASRIDALTRVVEDLQRLLLAVAVRSHALEDEFCTEVTGTSPVSESETRRWVDHGGIAGVFARGRERFGVLAELGKVHGAPDPAAETDRRLGLAPGS